MDQAGIAKYCHEIRVAVGESLSSERQSAVCIDANMEPMLKAILAFHAYSIGLHQRMVGSLVQDWIDTSDVETQLGQNRGTSVLKRASTALIYNTIEDRASRDEENRLKKEILKMISRLVGSLNLSYDERKLLILEAFLHDEGKWLESDQKEMRNIRKDSEGKDIPGIKIFSLVRKKNGDAEKVINTAASMYVNDKELENIRSSPLLAQVLSKDLHVDHAQDALTILIFRQLENDGLISQEERVQLEGIHTLFTFLSACRYGQIESRIVELKGILDDNCTERLLKKGLIIMVADELGKGPYFYDNNAESVASRIEKLANILELLRVFSTD